MYCTSDNGKEVTYLIDRRNDFWYVPGLHFPMPGDDTYQGFHENTLIDGELVLDKDSHHQISAKYLVFDCLVLDGSPLMHRTLDKRLAYFKERVFDPYKTLYKTFPQEIQYLPFVVELKAMQFAYGTAMMFKEILPKLPHGNDGLIFTCRNTPYKHGTDPHILKWKPEDENSVDFRLSMDFPLVQPDATDRAEGITSPYLDYSAMPVFNLLIWVGNDNDAHYGTLYLTEAEWEAWQALEVPLDDRIVECHMDAQGRWRFMRWRDDKDKPNHISTVESVIESIRDRVTEKELIDSAKGIRDEWKRREAEAKDASRKSTGGAGGAQAQAAGQKRKAEDQGGGRPSPGPQGGHD